MMMATAIDARQRMASHHMYQIMAKPKTKPAPPMKALMNVFLGSVMGSYLSGR